MTFNRYIAFRMITELIGAAACITQVYYNNNLNGIIITGVIALVWILGEIWTVIVFNRANPRTDELSDMHQYSAYRFAMLTLVIALTIIGFAGMLYTLVTRVPIEVGPMVLPSLAMLALAIADARYLWLEHDGTSGGDDED
ncbi:hypothetical protein BHAP_0977 [Bifidobacterium hapali]|uniref:Uncharacterized protein n=1 Tax=Bifidobacterium hapali TaxID=1630172 RepID=A0A261G0J3_9BIFI|nr:hypothetical protein [Bifidobacterium hapali]OZG64516.1 hypothetical protein BHAP_0977 [Bifidobacterium hapali]